jgi:hypothetical protein
VITDARARTIAADYHDGSNSSIEFSSTGTISDVDVLIADFEQYLSDEQKADPDFVALEDYIRTTGVRSPVPGWSRLWED